MIVLCTLTVNSAVWSTVCLHEVHFFSVRLLAIVMPSSSVSEALKPIDYVGPRVAPLLTIVSVLTDRHRSPGRKHWEYGRSVKRQFKSLGMLSANVLSRFAPDYLLALRWHYFLPPRSRETYGVKSSQKLPWCLGRMLICTRKAPKFSSIIKTPTCRCRPSTLLPRD